MAAVAILFGGWASTATADCSADGYEQQLTDSTSPTIAAALNDKRIQATGGEEWNEDHCATSALYKVAAPPATDPNGVDPRAHRGSWSTGTNTVTYNYGDPGGPYTFTLHRDADGSVAAAGGLCWESAGTVIAVAPVPGNVPGALDCSVP